MRDISADSRSPADARPLTTPASHFDHPAVESVEQPTEVHQGHYDVYEPIAGMAVVGVTDDAARVLLLVNEDAGHTLLPHAPVDPGEDFVAAGERAVRERVGIAVEVETIRRIRRKSFRAETDDDYETTGYDVVFEATPRDSSDPPNDPAIDDGDDWTVGWYETFPTDPERGNQNVVADIRSFLDR
ncbi:NUDIX domain-containing protein [Haloarchaeobius sp. TZWWS8]|uniref:NUDIX domain-containing protein n=1 Tax=Haloarchaeobius sp. TZWWS8 TaxID=3446121 RepID=UPI003EC00621